MTNFEDNLRTLLYFGMAVFLSMIFVMVWARTASRPSLGIRDGELLPLPNTPNGVATQSGNAAKRLEPIPWSGDWQPAKEKMLQILNRLPRTTLVANEPNYVWVVFRSTLFGFPDDVEFLFGEEAIHFRAVARLGYSDMGVNLKRMEMIKDLFQQ